MNLVLLGHAPEFAKAVVATCLSSLGSRIRPAIFIAMVVVAGSSVFAMHALGGPLRRWRPSGSAWPRGSFPRPSGSAMATTWERSRAP